MGNIIFFCLSSCYGVLSHCWDSITTARAAYLGLEGALSNPSPSWAGHFNDDLIAEILSRLPVKSLVRFRCVCKSWLALISDPNFAWKNAGRLKLLETVNPTRSIDLEAILKEEHRLEYTVLPEAPKLWVLGSCNGLICREEEKGGDLIIWNPSTRDTYCRLPKIELKKLLSCFYGFGYDSINEDYKVIVGLETKVTIFTSKTGSWKTVEVLPENVGGFDGEGCFVNGALHWLKYSHSNLKIISFDLAEEKFQELPPPNIRMEEVCSMPKIGKTINGNCLFFYLLDDKRHRHQEGIAITIWVMYEYGENGYSWTRVIQISSSSLPKPHIFDYTPITLLEDGQVLMNRISNRSKWEQFVLYDPKENHCKKCRRHVHDYFNRPKFYLETLVLPPKTSR